MSVLDNVRACRKLDRGDMLSDVRGLPGQCRTAWEEAQNIAIPDSYRGIDRIVVVGMGGSAIAGGLMGSLLALEGRTFLVSHRGYDLPPGIDSRTLLVASSYSGNTEETLSTFCKGLETEAKPLVITGGGNLLDLAEERKIPTFSFKHLSKPRAALGYGLMPLLAVANQLEMLPDLESQVNAAIASMESVSREVDVDIPSKDNKAKQLAQQASERLLVIYGGGFLTEVARRWKTQVNENANSWAFHEESPEAGHNAIQGYDLPRAISNRAFAVLLDSSSLHPRLRLNYKFVQRALGEAGVDSKIVDGRGESPLAQMLSLILMGDYVSCYLAFLSGVDPSSTHAIDGFKDWLSRQRDSGGSPSGS